MTVGAQMFDLLVAITELGIVRFRSNLV